MLYILAKIVGFVLLVAVALLSVAFVEVFVEVSGVSRVWSAGFIAFFAIVFVLLIFDLFGRGPLKTIPVPPRLQAVSWVGAFLLLCFILVDMFGRDIMQRFAGS